MSAASSTRPTPAWNAPPYNPMPVKTAIVTQVGHGFTSSLGFGLSTVRMTIGIISKPKIVSNVSSAIWLIV